MGQVCEVSNKVCNSLCAMGISFVKEASTNIPEKGLMARGSAAFRRHFNAVTVYSFPF